jgi:hypothetical protein
MLAFCCCQRTQQHLKHQPNSASWLPVQVQVIMKRLSFNHTNYGFCKNLTEHMLAGYHNKPFPVCISRPVSVGCIAKGPCQGYVGNTSGATGIILSIACGKHS